MLTQIISGAEKILEIFEWRWKLERESRKVANIFNREQGTCKQLNTRWIYIKSISEMQSKKLLNRENENFHLWKSVGDRQCLWDDPKYRQLEHSAFRDKMSRTTWYSGQWSHSTYLTENTVEIQTNSRKNTTHREISVSKYLTNY